MLKQPVSRVIIAKCVTTPKQYLLVHTSLLKEEAYLLSNVYIRMDVVMEARLPFVRVFGHSLAHQTSVSVCVITQESRMCYIAHLINACVAILCKVVLLHVLREQSYKPSGNFSEVG